MNQLPLTRSLAWLDAGTVHRDPTDPVWGEVFDMLKDDGGIGAQLWLNLDTGAMLLLAPSGGWKSGGRFHLFYARIDGGTAVDISGALGSILNIPTTYPAGDPSYWQQTKDDFSHAVASRLGI